MWHMGCKSSKNKIAAFKPERQQPDQAADPIPAPYWMSAGMGAKLRTIQFPGN
jgi:hypothetical protein